MTQPVTHAQLAVILGAGASTLFPVTSVQRQLDVISLITGLPVADLVAAVDLADATEPEPGEPAPDPVAEVVAAAVAWTAAWDATMQQGEDAEYSQACDDLLAAVNTYQGNP
jgi:hypothetical protein